MRTATIGTKDTAEVLSLAGIPVGYDKLREGIKQGVFTEFAHIIDMHDPVTGRGNYEYVIFRKDLEAYLRKYCLDELSPAVLEKLYGKGGRI